jgi:hypothetical protein
MSAEFTEAGALGMLLSPELRKRLGWISDGYCPPAATWEAAAGLPGFSTGERAMVACALALWNGTGNGVDVRVLGQLDSANLGRLGRCLCALSEGGSLATWAQAERRREDKIERGEHSREEEK